MKGYVLHDEGLDKLLGDIDAYEADAACDSVLDDRLFIQRARAAADLRKADEGDPELYDSMMDGQGYFGSGRE